MTLLSESKCEPEMAVLVFKKDGSLLTGSGEYTGSSINVTLQFIMAAMAMMVL